MRNFMSLEIHQFAQILHKLEKFLTLIILEFYLFDGDSLPFNINSQIESFDSIWSFKNHLSFIEQVFRLFVGLDIGFIIYFTGICSISRMFFIFARKTFFHFFPTNHLLSNLNNLIKLKEL